jgi:putative ABC transport system ATP-binding protein
MITVKNLVKKFKTGEIEFIALNGLSFGVPRGQFLAITGRSGSGKSTLLYQLGLLDHPDKGVITIDNQVVTELDDLKRVVFRRDNLGFIFQDYSVLPMLTAKENVMLPMLAQGVEENIVAKKAIEVLTKVGLGKKVDNLPSQLSGGEQQRVSIARAIIHNPKILFADEPTANIDTESSKDVLDIFLKLNREGQTVVMVTHEPEYAKLADREIKLSDGKIISDKMLNKSKQLGGD